MNMHTRSWGLSETCTCLMPCRSPFNVHMLGLSWLPCRDGPPGGGGGGKSMADQGLDHTFSRKLRPDVVHDAWRQQKAHAENQGAAELNSGTSAEPDGCASTNPPEK